MIHHFQEDISFEGLQEFTDPFRYMPHPLVKAAAEKIIGKIEADSILSDAFAEGKMLGVLVCKVSDCSKRAEHLPSSLLCELLQSDTADIVYIAGFSGNVGGRSIIEGFVPPIYDLTDPDGYFKEVKSGIYQTSKTIYLSPKSSSILFLNYEDYTVTLNKSANIIETKYILYKKANRICVANSQLCKGISPDIFNGIRDIEKVDEESLRRDILINKAKGFITGYLIGRGKSLTADSARLLNLTRQIKDTIYALVTMDSSDRSRMHQELRVLTAEAKQISWKLDDNKIRISSAINEDLSASGFNEEEAKRVRKYFSKRGLYPTLINQLCPGAKLFSVE